MSDRTDPTTAAAIRAALICAPDGLNLAELAAATGYPRAAFNATLQRMREELRARQQSVPGQSSKRLVYRLTPS